MVGLYKPDFCCKGLHINGPTRFVYHYYIMFKLIGHKVLIFLFYFMSKTIILMCDEFDLAIIDQGIWIQINWHRITLDATVRMYFETIQPMHIYFLSEFGQSPRFKAKSTCMLTAAVNRVDYVGTIKLFSCRKAAHPPASAASVLSPPPDSRLTQCTPDHFSA